MLSAHTMTEVPGTGSHLCYTGDMNTSSHCTDVHDSLLLFHLLCR
jgi:hypothetical protein